MSCPGCGKPSVMVVKCDGCTVVEENAALRAEVERLTKQKRCGKCDNRERDMKYAATKISEAEEEITKLQKRLEAAEILANLVRHTAPLGDGYTKMSTLREALAAYDAACGEEEGK